MKKKTALVIPDCHIPYHCKEAFDLMLKVAKDQRIDEIVLLGDFGEFQSVSTHAKDPSFQKSLVNEAKSVNKELDRLDRLFPHANKVYIEGNHEYRLYRYIRDRAPELDGIFNWMDLLKLNQRKKWKWIPYSPDQRYPILKSKLLARHEPSSGGAHSAALTIQKTGNSVIFGHIHRIQEYQTVMLDGRCHRGITPGWLGDQNHEVFNYVKGHHQWGLGFAIVHVLPDKHFHAQVVHIINGKCAYGGRVYK
jgi:predicted phosphodiesterase